MTQTRTLTFLSDPGHGWLAVPLADLLTLGIVGQISRYSYHDKNVGVAWLEEDCDAGVFMRAAAAAGWQVTIKETSTNNEARVRRLPAFGTGGGDETAHYRCVGEIRRQYGLPKRDRSLRGFIRRNRAEIDAHLRRCCGSLGTINDNDREQWIYNEDGLHAWARSEGVRL